ncbi:Zinc finger CCHC-type [Carpediemonas membranifera]|uniref:Zinc finger CCHC-type n=1 Tax=Carpediemonas membranifera TaxID=201153 RepID=A0A8J6AW97_9EUKA|nr:Zinc finger CCHC-type [Carpediemonas membranifera]|eukprot:KAG9395758.1 Zinc finger CCHC-type [Carpediemonas membranifera]
MSDYIPRPFLLTLEEQAFTKFRSSYRAYRAQRLDDPLLHPTALMDPTPLLLITRRLNDNPADLPADTVLDTVYQTFYSPRSNVQALAKLKSLRCARTGPLSTPAQLLNHIERFETIRSSFTADVTPPEKLMVKAYLQALPDPLAERIRMEQPDDVAEAQDHAIDELEELLNLQSLLQPEPAQPAGKRPTPGAAAGARLPQRSSAPATAVAIRATSAPTVPIKDTEISSALACARLPSRVRQSSAKRRIWPPLITTASSVAKPLSMFPSTRVLPQRSVQYLILVQLLTSSPPR